MVYTFTMLAFPEQFRRLARNAAKDYGLGWRVPRAYRQAAVAPVDPRKVLFVESSLAEMPDAFRLLFARFEADPAFDPRFISLGKHRVDAHAYLRNCEALAREAATARIIYLCDASDVVSSLPLRPETRVVQLWHACGAFKRFGMSTADLGFGLSRADIERHPFYGNLSLVTVSSPEVEWAYVEAMHLEGRSGIVRPLGVSRTDVFFDPAFHEQAFRHLFAAIPEAIGKRVILYAPTYRGDMSNACAPEPPDFSVLKQALGDDGILLVKQHPMVREPAPVPAGCENFVFEASPLPIDELLVVAHVLVTDYSSVVFEFALFNRPMVFFSPDLDDYLDDRNFYYDYDLMTPGPVVSTTKELASSLVAALGGDGDLAKVARFREFFMASCGGDATGRIWTASLEPGRWSSPNELVRRARAGIMHRRPHVAAARVALNAAYRVLDRDERDDEVVFVSRQTDVPSYDFAELARRFEERGWTATMHLQKVSLRNLPSYALHVAKELELLGRCKFVVLDRYDPVVSLLDLAGDHVEAAGLCDPVNLDFPQRPQILQLWHAFGAFKKFGFQYVDTLEGHSADFTSDWRIHRNNTWVACSGEGARAAFAEAFSCPVERVVPLKRPEYDELVLLRDGGAPAANHRPRVLMAPTLRKNWQVEHPFRDLYGHRREFEAGVDADFSWAFHPLESGLPAPGNVSGELLKCDVVVTDYSSLVYEAYLLGKPVLFYVPDIDSYRLTPGLNRDPLVEAPALCSRSEAELEEALQALVSNPGVYPCDQLENFIGDAFEGAADPVDFLLGQIVS